jgi:hypothetical protein
MQQAPKQRQFATVADRLCGLLAACACSKHLSNAKTHKGSANPILNFYYTFPHALLVSPSFAVYVPLRCLLCARPLSPLIVLAAASYGNHAFCAVYADVLPRSAVLAMRAHFLPSRSCCMLSVGSCIIAQVFCVGHEFFLVCLYLLAFWGSAASGRRRSFQFGDCLHALLFLRLAACSRSRAAVRSVLLGRGFSAVRCLCAAVPCAVLLAVRALLTLPT